MSNYIATDTDLAAIADAIRAKGGTSDPLTFPGGFEDAIADISSGGGNSVTGTFTIATIANNNFPTITHNLNTQKIAVLIYPLSNTVSADGGYQKFYSLLINANPIMQDDVSQWTFDWTGYNSKFSDVETVAIPITGTKLRIGTCHVSPWTTQNSWSVGGNPAVHLAYSGITITDNTVKIAGGGGGDKWAIGTYKYHVWKLG